jgi:hypothetical protein
MKKNILLVSLCLCLLQACVPKMVVDTKGRSGTFDYSRAEDLTNDKILCEELVKENVNLMFDYTRFAFAKYIELGTVGFVKADELKSKKINRECLKNRGHSILD